MKGWWSSGLSSVKNFVASVVDEDGVEDLRGNWLRVKGFFDTVQKTTDDGTMRQLKAKLPTIEACLNRMVEILIIEKKKSSISYQSGVSHLDLPPCYEYFLQRDGDKARRSTAVLQTSDVLNVDLGLSSLDTPENDFIIFSVCQFAKHNQPEGARGMAMRFLYRVLTELEPDDGSGSILSLCVDYAALPLCDALHKIGTQLDPRLPNSTSPGKKLASSSGAHVEAIDEDRAQLIALLRCICEKIEVFPESLCSVFTLRSAFSIEGHGATLMPLDLVALFLAPESFVHLNAPDRLAAMTNILRSITSVARCASPGLQDAIALRDDIPRTLFDTLRTNFVTLCKVPQNQELRLQAAIVAEIVRFFEVMLLAAPSVALRWELLKRFHQDFLITTTLPLFQAPNERTYIAVTTLLTHIMKDVLQGGSVLIYAIADALFVTRVDRQHHTFYSHTTAFPTDFLESTTNFADEYLWPRLSDVSDDVVCSTLQCLTALSMRAPGRVLKLCLNLDGGETPLFFSRAFLDSKTARDRGKSSLRISQLLPHIDVKTLFPSSLWDDEKPTRSICGTTLEEFTEDATRLMLQIEAALTPEEMNQHRPRVEKPPRTSSSSSSVSADTAAVAPIMMKSLASGTSSSSYCAGKAAMYDDNILFVHSVNDATMIRVMCKLLDSMTEHRFPVNTMLTEWITTTIAMPDLRIPLTLLDPERGRLALAIKRLSELVERQLGADKSHGITTLSLYQHMIARPFFDTSDEMLNMAANERVTVLQKSAKVFLEACVALEGFRQELTAVMCMQIVSQSMTEVQCSSSR